MGEEALGRGTPFLNLAEMERRWEVEKLEETGRSPESSLMQQMAVETGLLGASGLSQPFISGPWWEERPPARVPTERPYEEVPEVPAGDGGSPQDLAVSNEY